MDLSPTAFEDAADTLASDLISLAGGIDYDAAYAALRVGYGIAEAPSLADAGVGDLMVLVENISPDDMAVVELATLGAHLARTRDLDRALDAFLDDDAVERACSSTPGLDRESDRLEIAARYIASWA